MWNNKTIEWIDVELTSFCNIACPGCLRQEKKEQVKTKAKNVLGGVEVVVKKLTGKE